MKSLTLIKREDMDTRIARNTLHGLIDQIEDDELLEREIRKTPSIDFFNTTESELIARAKASLKSVEEGKTRNIKDFTKDVEACKKNRAI